MIHPPIVTAHGALGIWDEVVSVGVAAAFIILMAVTWLRSRSGPPDDSELPPGERPPDSAPDRFHLD